MTRHHVLTATACFALLACTAPARAQQATRLGIAWDLKDTHLDPNPATIQRIDDWCDEEAKLIIDSWQRELLFWRLHAARPAKGAELVIKIVTPAANQSGKVGYSILARGVWGEPKGGHLLASGVLPDVKEIGNPDVGPDRKFTAIVSAIKEDLENKKKEGFKKQFQSLVPVADGVTVQNSRTQFVLPLVLEDIGERLVENARFLIHFQVQGGGRNEDLVCRFTPPAVMNGLPVQSETALPNPVTILAVFLGSSYSTAP